MYWLCYLAIWASQEGPYGPLAQLGPDGLFPTEAWGNPSGTGPFQGLAWLGQASHWAGWALGPWPLGP